MYIRSAYLAVLIVVLLWMLLGLAGSGDLNYRELASAGARSFIFVAYLQIALICILAPVFMAGAIAQEASPKTWDILLTTPLSSLQIVLGNLFGRLFFILALLFASLPLFALTQYFGGVPGKAIFTSYLIAACAALLVGTIAIALSVSRLVGRRAVFAFYVAVVTYLAITAAIDVWIRQGGTAGVTWMTAVNPFLALHAQLNPSSYPAAIEGTHTGLAAWFLEEPVTTWCAGSLMLSVTLMILSTFTVRAGGLQSIGAGTSNIPWYRRIFGIGAKNTQYRAPRTVWANPIAWREAASRNATFGKIVARWSFIGLGAVFGLLLIGLLHVGNLNASEFRLALLSTIWAEVAVTALVAINMAATAVSREREDGTLDLILTTPITPGDYLWGKLRGLVAYLLPLLAIPIGTLTLAGLYVLLDGLGKSNVTVMSTPPGFTAPVESPALLPEAGLVAALVLVPFIAFCAMVGLQWSLRSKGTIGSVVATVGVVGVAFGILSLCGQNAGTTLNFLGPVFAALSPATMARSLLYPAEAMQKTVHDAGGELQTARASLFIGSICAAGLYMAIVYGIHTNMVRTFDFTVRKLAGER